jgi:hypothetical protein
VSFDKPDIVSVAIDTSPSPLFGLSFHVVSSAPEETQDTASFVTQDSKISSPGSTGTSSVPLFA